MTWAWVQMSCGESCGSSLAGCGSSQGAPTLRDTRGWADSWEGEQSGEFPTGVATLSPGSLSPGDCQQEKHHTGIPRFEFASRRSSQTSSRCSWAGCKCNQPP